jgi:hypothetical protein
VKAVKPPIQLYEDNFRLLATSGLIDSSTEWKKLKKHPYFQVTGYVSVEQLQMIKTHLNSKIFAVRQTAQDSNCLSHSVSFPTILRSDRDQIQWAWVSVW